MKTFIKILLLTLMMMPAIAIAHDFEVDGIYYKKTITTLLLQLPIVEMIFGYIQMSTVVI